MVIFGSDKPRISRLDFHARLALMAAMIMGYGVLFAADVFPLTYIPGVVLAFGLGYLRFFEQKAPLLPDSIWTLLTLAVVGGSMLLSFTGRLFFLDALNLIFLVLPLIKLLTARSERDYLQLYALAFAQLLYATIINLEISFGLMLMAYMACAMWGLILLTFRVALREHAAQPELSAQVDRKILSKRYPLFITLLLPAILIATTLLFFFIPRPGSGITSFGFQLQKRRSGFSDQVNLGDIGEILLDQSVVMRIKADEPMPDRPIYWRGVVHDQFDGMGWKSHSITPNTIRRGVNRIIKISDVPLSRLNHQTIYLDNLESNYLIHADFLAAVRARIPYLNLHHSGTASFPRHKRYLQSYEVWTHRESLVHLPHQTMDIYLQLPDMLDKRITKLTREITESSRDPLSAAKMLESYLKDNYQYALDSAMVPSSTPLSRFLFETRRGHCEYYASAMTIMLRLLGIHSRLVTGFYKGEYNETDDYFIIRQSHAHAWVEAHIDGKWQRFDPTPAASLIQLDMNLFKDISVFIDSLAFRWQRYVIHFGAYDQVSAFMNLRYGMKRTDTRAMKRWISNKFYGGGWILLLIPVAAGGIYLLRLNRGRSKNGDSIPGRRILHQRLAWLKRRLKKSGFRWSVSKTILEQTTIAGERFPDAAAPLRQWAEFYQLLRYGARPISEHQLKHLRSIQDEIIRSLKTVKAI